MARELKASTESAGVYQRQSGTVASAIGQLGQTVTQIGVAGVQREREQRQNQAQILAQAEQMNTKFKSTLDKSQVDFQSKLAEDRKEVFIASQKDVWDDKKLEKNRSQYEEEERGYIDDLLSNGEISNEVYNTLVQTNMPLIYSDANAKSKIQLGVAKINSGMAHENTLRTMALNKGNVESANVSSKNMLDQGYIDNVTYQNQLVDNGRLAEKGLLRNTIKSTTDQNMLYDIGTELDDMDNYTNLSLEDRATMKDELQSQQVNVLQNEQLPAKKALGNALQTNTLTEDMIWASKAPQMDKELYSMLLKTKRTNAYNVMPTKVKDNLSRMVDKYMNGTFISGSPNQADNIIEYMQDNKLPTPVIQDVLEIFTDGQASDSAIGSLELKEPSVKYPTKVKEGIDQFRNEFDKLTSDLPTGDKINGFGDAYRSFYKGAKTVGNHGEDRSVNVIYGTTTMDSVMEDSLKSIRDARVKRDTARTASSNLGIISIGDTQVGYESAPIKAASELSEESSLDLNRFGLNTSDEDEVRRIMQSYNTSLDKAVNFYKTRTGK